MSRELYCAICCQHIQLSGKSFKEQPPSRAITVAKGVSVCALHISDVVPLRKAKATGR